MKKFVDTESQIKVEVTLMVKEIDDSVHNHINIIEADESTMHTSQERAKDSKVAVRLNVRLRLIVRLELRKTFQRVVRKAF